jgi:hypothetical protein
MLGVGLGLITQIKCLIWLISSFEKVTCILTLVLVNSCACPGSQCDHPPGSTLRGNATIVTNQYSVTENYREAGKETATVAGRIVPGMYFFFEPSTREGVHARRALPGRLPSMASGLYITADTDGTDYTMPLKCILELAYVVCSGDNNG